MMQSGKLKGDEMDIDRIEAKINDRLDGNLEYFLLTADTHGMNHAIEKFHLHDLPYPALHDWTQKQLGHPVWSQRGLLPAPTETEPNYADDFVSAVIRLVTRLERTVEERDKTIADKDKAIEYYRHNPSKDLARKIHEIMEKA
jgi:hypothetical protein